MAEKKLVLIINAHQGYTKNTDEETKFAKENSLLFSAITETYIPLLNMFQRLESQGVPFKIVMVISPVLCSLLSNPLVQKKYIDYLDNLINLGRAEVERCKNSECRNQALDCLENVERTKFDFAEKYSQDLISAFKTYEKKGLIELAATSATYAYLPHFADFPEAISAQVETGLYSQRQFFGETGEGFWLPHMGWSKGIDRILRSYGMNYAVVDAKSILFSDECPAEGIFSPVRTKSSLVLFGADPETPKDILGDDGFFRAEAYRSQSRDIAFDLPQEKIDAFFKKDDPRLQTEFKYWSNESDGEILVPYDRESAKKQVIKDAIKFYESKVQKLDKAAEIIRGENAVLVCTIPAEALGQIWHEGIAWLENVILCTQNRRGFSFELCKNLIANQFSLPKISPYPCSSNGFGYGEDLLNNSNSWMIRYVRKATERMITLTERFPSENSLKERLLNMAAKQLLLAQSSEWSAMINEGKFPDLVERIFTEEILDFSRVFDALASNSVSTEWLTHCERENEIFPWLNYRIFSRKK